ncbi:DNA polymerase IV [Kibdelosporangium phytohabitans]|uniref:DNA polymerase IV n=1 Tax=Kibdelosporangium phytohabitans TaxID=860235 RepID=A0A0N9I910_9PSEU|nr:DNA polymerase IV [Kibdelosporangium phytohabitans]ALG12864.1 DNA polymerase IV [Kibdelosporangium phytohabitans]MBE1464563.1 DNA polymerase-4 [Kibdelosporangium phytohabitans]
MGRSGDLPRGLVDRFVVRDGVWPDDTGCPILHVDMDAFYASVEIRERPELKDKPVVVGGVGNRGVVSSANYIARKYGVRSAMPTSRARRLCPQAVYVSPTFGLYQEVSRGVLGIFRDITPLVEPLSLDEAFLDVSGALRRMGMSPGRIGQVIRDRVEAEHGITCSVGVAPTKFVAKLASGLCKPDGMLVVPKASVLEFLHPLPVSALWGVGRKTAERLADVGLERVADVAAAPLPRLRRIIGNALAEHLHPLARGFDDRAVEPESAEKSVGAEETFEVDHWDRELLKRELLRLSEKTASALRGRGLRGRTVSIKVRFSDFTTISRSRTLLVPTDVTQEIFKVACQLLVEQTPPGAVRLIGVRMEQLSQDDSGEQLLLDAPENGWREADQAADRARAKFGHAAIRPASLLTQAPDRSGETEPRPDRIAP